MAVERLFEGGTLRDYFVAAVSRADETTAQLLRPVLSASEDLETQREDAWAVLTAGTRWARDALNSVDVGGTDATPVRDSDTAFQRAQHLDRKLWELSQEHGFHDAVALLVESVKQACYHGADLGPIPGGRLGSLIAPGDAPRIVEPVPPNPDDLRAIGRDAGEALRWYAELGLGDLVEEARAALDRAALSK